jgi:amino acid transporter
MIIVEFYLSVWPLGERPSVENFFANYVSVVAVIVIWIGAQLWYRGPIWVNAAQIDLDACRRFYADHEDEESHPPAMQRSIKRAVGRLFE